MKQQKKQTKKAVTLLTKIEKGLAEVLVECSAIEKSVEKNVRELLNTAEVAIAAAKEFITPEPSSAVHHKTAHTRTRARRAKKTAGAKRVSARARKRPITRAA